MVPVLGTLKWTHCMLIVAGREGKHGNNGWNFAERGHKNAASREFGAVSSRFLSRPHSPVLLGHSDEFLPCACAVPLQTSCTEMWRAPVLCLCRQVALKCGVAAALCLCIQVALKCGVAPALCLCIQVALKCGVVPTNICKVIV